MAVKSVLGLLYRSHSCRLVFFRYRIIAAGTPGVASANALQAHPRAFEGSPFLNGFYRIGRAGRGVAAV